jgi:hypothetical protein
MYITLLQLPVGYEISPLARFKFKILTTSREEENLFLPLLNTNFISKSFKIIDLTKCGERH